MRMNYLRLSVFGILVLAFMVYAGFLYEEREANFDKHHHDHSDQYHDHSHREKILLPENLSFPSHDPDRVILNLTEAPETSIAVNWRTDTTVLSGTIEWAKATAGPEFLNDVHSVVAAR